MSDSKPPARPAGAFAVVAIVVVVLVGVLLLSRVLPGPKGLQVTVIETGKVATSKEP